MNLAPHFPDDRAMHAASLPLCSLPRQLRFAALFNGVRSRAAPTAAMPDAG